MLLKNTVFLLKKLSNRIFSPQNNSLFHNKNYFSKTILK